MKNFNRECATSNRSARDRIEGTPLILNPNFFHRGETPVQKDQFFCENKTFDQNEHMFAATDSLFQQTLFDDSCYNTNTNTTVSNSGQSASSSLLFGVDMSDSSTQQQPQSRSRKKKKKKNSAASPQSHNFDPNGVVPTPTQMEGTATTGSNQHLLQSQSQPIPQVSSTLQLASTACSPKAALHVVYGKAPRRKVVSGEHFHTFHDSGAAHLLRWTCIFVCPITAELFFAVPYSGCGNLVLSPNTSFNGGNDNNNTKDPRIGKYWFQKKSNAEHGAAACAHDCIVYRDQVASLGLGSVRQQQNLEFISTEPPYLRNEAIHDIPSTINSILIPTNVLLAIQEQQREIRRVSGGVSNGGD